MGFRAGRRDPLVIQNGPVAAYCPSDASTRSLQEREEPCSISRNKALLRLRTRRSVHRLVDLLRDILGAVFEVLGAIIDCSANRFDWAFRLVSEKVATDEAGEREGKNAKGDGQVFHEESFDVAARLRLWLTRRTAGRQRARTSMHGWLVSLMSCAGIQQQPCRIDSLLARLPSRSPALPSRSHQLLREVDPKETPCARRRCFSLPR